MDRHRETENRFLRRYNMRRPASRTPTTTSTSNQSRRGMESTSRARATVFATVHLERYGGAGKHFSVRLATRRTNGGLGMLAIACGLDVAVAMGGGPFHFHDAHGRARQPEGKLSRGWPQDVILEILRQLP